MSLVSCILRLVSKGRQVSTLKRSLPYPVIQTQVDLSSYIQKVSFCKKAFSFQNVTVSSGVENIGNVQYQSALSFEDFFTS